MTMTQDDWAALASAAQQGGTQYLEALAAQQAQIQQQKQGLTAGIPGAPGPNFVAGIDAQAVSDVQAAYPDLAWMLNVPELAANIVQWAQSGEPETVVAAQLGSNPWYASHQDSIRKWINQVYQDPASANADLQAQESAISATLQQMGLPNTPDQVRQFAQQSLAMGWTDQQIKDEISQNITPGQTAGQFSWNYGGISAQGAGMTGNLLVNSQNIRAEAGKFLVPISDSTVSQFAINIANGTMDIQAVTAYMQQQAESLYPSIKGAIAAGTDPSTYVTPYKEVAAQLLGVDPGVIDMTNKKWNRALSQPGPDGQPVAMSLYDWQQLLMKDPQYNYNHSINAKDRASSIAQGLGEMFGRAPSGPAGSTAFAAAGAPRIAGAPIT